MADLIELNQWENGIYQLETEDPVLGGVDGIDNLQAKQLGNRTQYLKTQVELRATIADVAAQVAALVDSSPVALDTLNELAAALGDDPNFAATITNALALKAPLASPVFTGDPKAPTPAAADNDTSIATTAFVQAAIAAMLQVFSSDAEAQAFTILDKSISPGTLNNALKGSNQSLTADGYQKLPGGLIIQWGKQVRSVGSGLPQLFVLPIAFPNAIAGFSLTTRQSVSTVVSAWEDGSNSTSISIRTNVASGSVFIIAIGY